MGTQAETMEKCWLLVRSTKFAQLVSYISKTTCSGVAAPIVGWAHTHQSCIKMPTDLPTDLPTAQSGRRSSDEVLLYRLLQFRSN